MDNGEIHVHLACKLSRGRAQFKLDSLHLLWRQHANALFCLCDPFSAQGGCGEVHVCQPEDVIDVFVLCDGSLDGITRFPAGSVLQGVPESLAEANDHWLDSHPAAVEHALADGAPAIDYQPEA